MLMLYNFFFSEKATDGTQASENWGLFMEVCDVINETEEG
jgi:hypothetical protein